MEYTKGEWKLLDGVKPEYNGYVIQSVEWGVNLAYAETFDVEPTEALANAHLIALSPRMFELLKRMVEGGWSTARAIEAKEIVRTLA